MTITFTLHAGLEFIYAQSPNNMKGLQIGIFYLIFGIFSAIGSTIYFGYSLHSGDGGTSTPWSHFCLVLIAIGLVGFVVYVIVACCYRNRQRPAADEAEVQRMLMYANVYGAKT